MFYLEQSGWGRSPPAGQCCCGHWLEKCVCSRWSLCITASCTAGTSGASGDCSQSMNLRKPCDVLSRARLDYRSERSQHVSEKPPKWRTVRVALRINEVFSCDSFSARLWSECSGCPGFGQRF